MLPFLKGKQKEIGVGDTSDKVSPYFVLYRLYQLYCRPDSVCFHSQLQLILVTGVSAF